MSPMPINHPVLVFARRVGDFLFSPAGLAAIVLIAIVVFVVCCTEAVPEISLIF